MCDTDGMCGSRKTRNAIVLVWGATALAGCYVLPPISEVDVPVPIRDVEVRMEIRGLWDEQYVITAANPTGSVTHVVWENWGPARHASIYLTRDRRLVVIGGGGNAEMVLLRDGERPKWIPYGDRVKENGDDWKYVGAVDGPNMTFTPPDRGVECIPLYGAGVSQYRMRHQDMNNCPET